MYECNAGDVFKINELTINKQRCNLIVKCFEIPHYAYTNVENKTNEEKGKI